MSNIYHLLAKMPYLTKKETPSHIERLAVALVDSGKMRIDTDYKINFVRFSVPSLGANLMISHKELLDPMLADNTRMIIAQILAHKHPHSELNHKVAEQIHRLEEECRKNIEVDRETELKIARVLVQSAEPVVIHLLLLERTEIFVSFSHTIGDMLDIQSWQTVGNSNGLQSTDSFQSKVLVSCGGNPFIQDLNKSKGFEHGDGYPALARLMVIAAQELGHYADIIRNEKGRKISRHSCNLQATKAKEKVRIARLNDIEKVERLERYTSQSSIREIAELERHTKFYIKQRKRFSAIRSNMKAKRLFAKFNKSYRKYGLDYLSTLPESKYQATNILLFIDDMKNNLAPKEDAYKRKYRDEEEAIMCAEALARVPQQVIKWGHKAVAGAWPNLYKIYYGEVIPSCEKFYKRL